MKYTYLLLIAVVDIFSSCGSTKNMIYLKDNASDVNYSYNKLIKSIPLQPYQYRLKPDDRLSINVYSLTDDKLNFLKKPDLEIKVDDMGHVTLPVIGMVDINNLTLKEAEEKLKKVISEYLKGPEVNIRLVNFNITVLGEVNRQGTYMINEPKINILNAIGTAGGLTDNANMKSVRIIRNENNVAKIYQLDVLKDDILSTDKFYLQPNDIVLINPLKSKSSNQQRVAIISLVFSVISSLAWIFIRIKP